MRTQQMTVPLHSLGCGSTGRALVERSLRELPGVLEASVNPVTEMAYVEFDPAQCREDEVMAAVDRTGYGEALTAGLPSPAHGVTAGGVLSAGRVALTGGLWLALGFTVCAAGAALLPGVDDGFRLWALVLPGVETLSWTEYALGVPEVFVLGAFGGWLFAWVYNAIPDSGALPSRRAQNVRRPMAAPRTREVS